ncbi:hypothetical protein D3C87_2047320 [compost metagenome]
MEGAVHDLAFVAGLDRMHAGGIGKRPIGGDRQREDRPRRHWVFDAFGRDDEWRCSPGAVSRLQGDLSAFRYGTSRQNQRAPV